MESGGEREEKERGSHGVDKDACDVDVFVQTVTVLKTGGEWSHGLGLVLRFASRWFERRRGRKKKNSQ